MAVYSLAYASDEFVLHFETSTPTIEAGTLSEVLKRLAEAARIVNANANLGYAVRLEVVALEAGSFRVRLKPAYESLSNLFSRENRKQIIMGVIASAIWHYTHEGLQRVPELERRGEVVLQAGDDQVHIPADTFEQLEVAQGSAGFVEAVAATVKAIANDPRIRELAFEDPHVPTQSPLVLHRKALLDANMRYEEEWLDEAFESEADLLIVRAILDGSHRRWEFRWKGQTLSAPITDAEFHRRFADHHVTIAPGDRIGAILSVRQQRNLRTGAVRGIKYEVRRVLQFVPRSRSR